jgi:hypothetical protein
MVDKQEIEMSKVSEVPVDAMRVIVHYLQHKSVPERAIFWDIERVACWLDSIPGEGRERLAALGDVTA